MACFYLEEITMKLYFKARSNNKDGNFIAGNGTLGSCSQLAIAVENTETS